MVLKQTDNYRASGFALVSTGTSIGMMIWPLIHANLIEYYTWRGAVLLQAGFQLQGLVLGMVIGQQSSRTTQIEENETLELIPSGKKCSKETEATQHNAQGVSQRELMWDSLKMYSKLTQNCTFCIYMASIMFIDTAHYGIIIYFTYLADYLGATLDRSVLVMSIFGISATVLRMPSGYAGDMFTTFKSGMMAAAFLIAGFTGIVFYAFPSYTFLCFYAGLFGTLSGESVSLYIPELINLNF